MCPQLFLLLPFSTYLVKIIPLPLKGVTIFQPTINSAMGTERTFLFSRRKSFRSMILRDIWGKKLGILKREIKALIVEFCRAKRIFPKVLAIFYPLQNLSHAWIMFDICYLESGTLVISSMLNADALIIVFCIGLPKPLLSLQLPSEGKAS